MDRLDTKALLDRLDAARTRAAGAGVLAFDADGTLWSGDVGDDFFDTLVEEGAVLPAAQAALAGELAAAGVSVDGAPERGMRDAYHAGRFDEERFYQCVAWAAAGRPLPEVRAFARRVQDARNLGTRLHGEVRPVLAWAAAEGVPVYVVSASPRPVVQEGALRLGLDEARVLGAEAVVEADLMKPASAGPIPYGPGKVRALRLRVPAAPVLGAFGDNVFDIELLRLAAVPVAVRPKARLLARQEDVPGLSVSSLHCRCIPGARC